MSNLIFAESESPDGIVSIKLNVQKEVWEQNKNIVHVGIIRNCGSHFMRKSAAR